MKIFDEAYNNLKNKIGRVPYLQDFEAYNSLDPVSILSKFGNHYHLLHRNEDELFILTSYEDKVLSMISLELTNGKRIHELILLRSEERRVGRDGSSRLSEDAGQSMER